MPNVTSSAAPPKRRWYQYSLRTLFVVVTLFCILMGTVVKQIVIPAERQRAAVEQLEGLGGRFTFAEITNDESWFRQTLRKWLPSEYLDAIKIVWLNGSRVSDTDLVFLEDLAQLKALTLG